MSFQLGSSSLYTPRIGLGCMGMSEYYGPTNEAEALRTLQVAYELGVRHFDTADAYGRGANEELLGKFFSSISRDFLVATKAGIDRRDTFHSRYINGSREYVRNACERSLKRLKVEVIDLYYIHRIDPLVPVEDTVGEMSLLMKEGKIRAIGLSETSERILRRANAVHPVTALQSEYSLWSREIEKEILPACRELNVALVAYSPLGKGFLSGNIRKPEQFTEDDYRKNLPRFSNENISKNLDLLRPIEEMALSKGCTSAQIALAWVLSQGKDVFPIPGTKTPKHLKENLAASEICLTEEEVQKLSSFFDSHQAHGERYGEAAMNTIRRAY